MTRTDFIHNITTWEELLDFCNEYDCGLCDEIVEDNDRDDEIDADVEEAIRNQRWYDINGYLDNIPTGYNYYRRNGSFDYVGLDDADFETYKDEILDWGDSEEIWDDEVDEDYDVFAEQEEAVDGEPAPEPEDFTVSDLIGMCCLALATIEHNNAQLMREEERRIQQLYPKILK